MLSLIQIEISNRFLPYSLFIIGSFIVSLFVDFSVVISAAFLVMIRLNQMLNQLDYVKGALGFYFLLPVPRHKIIIAKNSTIGLVLLMMVITSRIGNILSSQLGIGFYTEGITGVFADLLVWFAFTIGATVILNMQRFYLVMSTEKMMANTKKTVVVLLIVFFLFYTQILKGHSDFIETIVVLFDRYILLFWCLSVVNIIAFTLITIKQIRKKDIDYV